MSRINSIGIIRRAQRAHAIRAGQFPSVTMLYDDRKRPFVFDTSFSCLCKGRIRIGVRSLKNKLASCYCRNMKNLRNMGVSSAAASSSPAVLSA